MNFFIKTYGCQMNVVDSQIITSILLNHNYELSETIEDADIILFNTCSIREKAEQTLLYKLDYVKFLKKNKNIIVGVLGCMAQRLKDKLLENQCVDFVVGTDSYRQLPNIIANVIKNNTKINSTDFDFNECYEDITPEYNNKISAFIPIARGCNNMCSYCVVPYTRGPEKSRNIYSIIKEVENLSNKNYKEITLLGENVNSYEYYDIDKDITYNFSKLLEIIVNIDKNIRIRFTSSHPKDLSDDVINTISKYDNICNYIHLPVQSGSNKILKLMNRPYTREDYLDIVYKIKKNIPDCSISTDIMTGFCDETEEDHKETLDLIDKVKFDFSFDFIYSERSGTYSAKYMKDNVDNETKNRRLNEIISLQRKYYLENNKKCIDKIYEILVEGKSSRDNNCEWYGRNLNNRVCIFNNTTSNIKIGDFIKVKIKDCTSGTLLSEII